MQFLVLGKGKTGSLVAEIAQERGHTVRALDETENVNASALTAAALTGIDAVIDFTTPEAALKNMRAVLNLSGRIVVGTTGWYAHLDEMTVLALQKGGALLYGTNFSIGVQKLFRLTASLAKLQGYNFSISETHHVSKLDAPSGTAITLREIIRLERDRHSRNPPRCPQPPRLRPRCRLRRRVARPQIRRLGLPRNLRPVVAAVPLLGALCAGKEDGGRHMKPLAKLLNVRRIQLALP
jgi:dihydrodipicolinate reductase